MALPSRFAGEANAIEFAYGVNPNVAPLQVLSAPTATGAGTVTLALGQVALNDGTTLVPLNANAPITIGGGTSQETVTPSAVNTGSPAVYGSSSLTATFSYVHGIGDAVRSGTVGLQEAINFMAAAGGGVVVVDAKWFSLGGTTAMIAAATLPSTVAIVNRSTGTSALQSTTVSLTSGQIIAMYTTPVELLPAPGTGAAYLIQSMVLNYAYLTAAYTGGGAIQASYGTALTYSATATVAATFLTSPAANQIIEAAGVVASTLSSNITNKEISISNASNVFASGSGTMTVTLFYRTVTGLV